MFVRLLHRQQELERDPLLLGDGEEGPGADAVVEAVLDVLPQEIPGAVGQLEEPETLLQSQLEN